MSTIPEYIKEAAEKHCPNIGIDTIAIALVEANRRLFIAGATSDVAKRYAGETGMRWIKWTEQIPDDWESKINRLIGDTFALHNSLFEHINDGLCKIGGTGRAEYSQLEWLYEPLPANPEK